MVQFIEKKDIWLSLLFSLYSESDCVHKLELGDWNLFPLILIAIFHRKGISLVTNVDHLYVSHLFCCTSCVTEIR